MRGAGWRLACLLLATIALSGHARPSAEPDRRDMDATLAEVLLERDGALVARGSAVVIAAREEAGEHACYLLTVGHVVAPPGGPADVRIVLSGEGAPRTEVPARLLRLVDAEDRDLAVVRAVGADCRPARLGPEPEAGADVWLAGFPRRGLVRFWPGHIRAPMDAAAARWTIDGAVTEGASGGGVFDARSGELLGVIQGYWIVRLFAADGSVGAEAGMGTTAAIPLSRVRAVLAEWGLDDLLAE